MRTLRQTLAGLVSLALAAGITGIAVAQEEAEAEAVPTGVVIEATWLDELDDGRFIIEPGAAFYTISEMIEVWSWDSTDPRLSGDATSRAMVHRYPSLGTSTGYDLYAWALTLVNGDGSWTGTGTGLRTWEDPAEFGNVETMTLHGAGAYEDLTAYLTYAGESSSDARPYTDTYRGLIVAGELPPIPEPPVE